ncbi:hypothetical protein G9P44_002226 [Scheffersomyces stipitis]|nr:hypothetical protein G9P44_002226 [Scheffersomyces stipitis]
MPDSTTSHSLANQLQAMKLDVHRDKQDVVIDLVQKLHDSTQLKKNGKCIKFSNTIFNSKQTIDSWKFAEFDYSRSKIELPIRARGLFTVNDNKIVARGYDKFFNVDEVAATKLKDLPSSTVGPYDVTLKENGCIILIGGLETGEIVVCSKHSTGYRDDSIRNHALAGENELKNQVSTLANKSITELAKFLYENNLTAVTELCDDSFEEHVLPYTKEKSGLYLHGLNYNTIKFNTVPIEQATEFAKEWGFKTIESLRYNDVDELFTFLDECAKTGTYNGKEAEGFVIRCHHKKDNSDFFFKYKFEEPYLLYRQFREVTRKIFVENKEESEVFIKTHRMITAKYIGFVRELFEKQPQLLQDFANGYGIIKIRQLFLEHLNEANGMNLLTLDKKMAEEVSKLDPDNKTKYVLVPIATIGCGKTTVFLTLNKLFPEWVHLQNDNIKKGNKFKIIDSSLSGLVHSPVVLFDRNNSSFRERQQILDDFAKRKTIYFDQHQEIKFIAVSFINNLDEESLWNLTYNRIKDRGDNHQSIKSSTDPQLAEKVMRSFISRFQEVAPETAPDKMFDSVIKLQLTETESSLANVKIVIRHLQENYPELVPKVPSDDEIKIAFEESLSYKPDFVKNMAKTMKPAYYGISIPSDFLISTIDSGLGDDPQWRLLKTSARVQESFHITLGHSFSLKENKSLTPAWKEFNRVFQPSYENKMVCKLKFFADVNLTKIIINHDKLICILAEVGNYYKNWDEEIPKLATMNQFLHITVGTLRPEIKPRESNSTLERLFGQYNSGSTDLSDGEYTLEDGEVIRVVSFTEPVTIEKAGIFAHY